MIIKKFSNNVEFIFLGIVYFLVISRIAVPYVIYLYIPSLTLLFAYALYLFFSNMSDYKFIKSKIKQSLLLCILSIIFIFSSIITHPFPVIILKGIVELSFLFILIFSTIVLVVEKKFFHNFN